MKGKGLQKFDIFSDFFKFLTKSSEKMTSKIVRKVVLVKKNGQIVLFIDSQSLHKNVCMFFSADFGLRSGCVCTNFLSFYKYSIKYCMCTSKRINLKN